jgi:hypothetical protein
MKTDSVNELLNPAEVLLSDYLSLRRIQPNRSEWHSLSLEGNPPRYYRFRRIVSCLMALDLDFIAVEDFEKGPFIRKFSNSDLAKVEQILNEGFLIEFGTFIDERNSAILPDLFVLFFKLYKNLDDLKNTFSSLIEAPTHFWIPIITKEQVVNKYADQEKTIERILVYLLNREEKVFSKSEMIQKFDFPDVDLDDIDMEWV